MERAEKEWVADEIRALEQTLPGDDDSAGQQELFARLMEVDPDLATRYRKAYLQPDSGEVYKQQQRFVKREQFWNGVWNRLLYSKDRKPGDKMPTNWKVAAWLGGGILTAILLVAGLLALQERAKALDKRNDTIASLAANLVDDLPVGPLKYNDLLVTDPTARPGQANAAQGGVGEPSGGTVTDAIHAEADTATNEPRSADNVSLPAGPTQVSARSSAYDQQLNHSQDLEAPLPVPPSAAYGDGGALPLPAYQAAPPKLFATNSGPATPAGVRLFTATGVDPATLGAQPPQLFQVRRATTATSAATENAAPKLYTFTTPGAPPNPGSNLQEAPAQVPAPAKASLSGSANTASSLNAAVSSSDAATSRASPNLYTVPGPMLAQSTPSSTYLFGAQTQPNAAAPQVGPGQAGTQESALPPGEPAAQPATPEASATSAPPLSADAAQLLGLTVMPGDVFPARLVLGINVADGGQVPVVAETLPQYCATPLRCPQLRFVGVASIDSGNYVTIDFRSLILDAQAVPFVGIAADLDYNTALKGNIIQEAPAAVQDLVRGSIGGFSDYLQALQNQKSVTVLENGTVVQNQDVGSLSNYLLGAAAETFALPTETTAVVRRVQIHAGTPIQVVAGSVIGGNGP